MFSHQDSHKAEVLPVSARNWGRVAPTKGTVFVNGAESSADLCSLSLNQPAYFPWYE